MKSFVILLGVVAADFEAIGLNYQAAWGCNYPSTKHISANLQFSTSNLTLINEFYKHGGVSLYPFTGWIILLRPTQVQNTYRNHMYLT